jgi:hypothetical protein
MADGVSSHVLDNGLAALDTQATHLYICSQEPTTFLEASSTYALGNKNFGAGAVFGAPAAGTPNGRKVTSAVVPDGSVTGTGTAVKYAVCDNTNSRLLAWGSLSASLGVVSGNTFTLTAFDVRLPSA